MSGESDGGLSLDEIVARNVERIREERGMSRSELARKMGVSRPLAFEYENARPGRKQREFRWTEIARLCWCLRTNVFELVLPPEGDRDVHRMWDLLDGATTPLPGEAQDAYEVIMGRLLGSDVRSALSGVLFDMDDPSTLQPKKLEVLSEKHRKEMSARARSVIHIADQLMEAAEDSSRQINEEES